MKFTSSLKININNLLSIAIFLSLFLLSACGASSSDPAKVQLAENKAPSINAGEDLLVQPNSDVRMNASASDSDGIIESYNWIQISGATINLTGENSANASFIAPSGNGQPLELSFTVTATDDKGASATDTVNVTINNEVGNSAPTVSAGGDISVSELSNVQLSATATDSDGNIVSYSWTQISGTNVALSGANAASVSFTAPNLISGSEQLSFSITVVDNSGDTATDTVVVTVNAEAGNQAPTVNAGSDQTVNEDTSVQLSVTAADSDGTIESYSWSQSSGQSVTISNSETANASFTAPSLNNDVEITLTFTVVVLDNDGASSSDSISVTVSPSSTNTSPTISITSPSQNGSQPHGQSTLLTATAGDSEDGDISASIEWSSSLDGDLGSGSSLSVNLSEGLHTITALVTDSGGLVSQGSVSYTVDGNATLGSASLTWSAPTENTDDSQLTDLAGFKIYYGESENTLDMIITIDSTTALSHVIDTLEAGKTYYFGVTAYNENGLESAMSTISSKLIPG